MGERFIRERDKQTEERKRNTDSAQREVEKSDKQRKNPPPTC